jgi:RpiR family carbohydrate utilization transcriptional regulator
MSDTPKPTPDSSMTLLESIVDRMDSLRPSDAKVAEVVLASPVSVLDLSIAGLAEAAGVSEPTVIRFCAAIGYEGYRSFKIALAQAVALGLPVENATIQHDDSTEQLVGKVFQRTISSLDRARWGLDVAQVERAIEAIVNAKELTFLGMGASQLVALDAQQKFPLFGIPCHAFQDAHIQFMGAALTTPETVVVAISETGWTAETLRAAQAAKDQGATLIVITGNKGPLAEIADIELRSTTFEDTDLFTPTVSRLAASVVLDILAFGVAVRRPPEFLARVGEMRAKLTAVRSESDDFGDPGQPSPE